MDEKLLELITNYNNAKNLFKDAKEELIKYLEKDFVPDDIKDGIIKTFNTSPKTKTLDTRIDELELSVRSYNCLRRAGIFTIRELLDRCQDKQDLMRIRNIGPRCADELLAIIKEFR